MMLLLIPDNDGIQLIVSNGRAIRILNRLHLYCQFWFYRLHIVMSYSQTSNIRQKKDIWAYLLFQLPPDAPCRKAM